MSRPSSTVSSTDSSSRPALHSDCSSSKNTNTASHELNSSLLRTAAASSPASTNRTSLLSPRNTHLLKHPASPCSASDPASLLLFTLSEQDHMSLIQKPIQHRFSHEQSIEELLSTLGYHSPTNPSPNPSPSAPASRPPLLMQDIDGQEFSLHEHSLSPVS